MDTDFGLGLDIDMEGWMNDYNWPPNFGNPGNPDEIANQNIEPTTNHTFRDFIQPQNPIDPSLIHTGLKPTQTPNYQYPQPPYTNTPTRFSQSQKQYHTEPKAAFTASQPVQAAKEDRLEPEAVINPSNGSFDPVTGNYSPKLGQRKKRGCAPGNTKRLKQLTLARKSEMTGPSKAARQREELVRRFGEDRIASDGELKGLTRTSDEGFLEWCNPSNSDWFRAAPHDNFREEFIAMDRAKHPKYEPPLPGEGWEKLDVTSNCSVGGQNTWKFDKEGWASIEDSKGNRVGFMEKRPTNEPMFPEGEFLMHNGMIMLDPDDRPIYNWADIPLCFSSKLEGGRMEALRRVFPWLRLPDFRARMPRIVVNEKGVTSPLGGLSTLSQRMARFRDTLSIEPWIERCGTVAKTKRKRNGKEHHTDSKETKKAKKAQGNPPSARPQEIDNAAIIARPQYDGPEPLPPPGTIDPQYVHYPDPTETETAAAQQWRDDRERSKLTTPPLPAAPFSTQSAYPPAPLSFSPAPLPPDTNIFCDVPAPPPSSFSAYPSPPTALPAPNGTDFRFCPPPTDVEEAQVNAALRLTRADFNFLHGFAPPTLPGRLAYNEQYQFLQNVHTANWRQGGDAPLLRGVESWTGSWEAWELPVLTPAELKWLLLLPPFWGV